MPDNAAKVDRDLRIEVVHAEGEEPVSYRVKSVEITQGDGGLKVTVGPYGSLMIEALDDR
jgi:hypothetical protein